MTKKSRQKLYEKCEKELFTLKQEALDALDAAKQALNPDISGDAGDMSQAIEQRHTAKVQRDKYEKQLREINSALERIKEKTYGLCEETGEEIEEKRLLAIPWTRYSVEGAEGRERATRHYVSPSEEGMFEDTTNYEEEK